MAGIRTVTIQGLNTGTLSLSENLWGHKIGTVGEEYKVYRQDGSHRVQWTDAKKLNHVTWYKRHFDTPHGNDPVALDMSTMGKGMVWINGRSIGRYWVSYLSPLGKPSQSMYHIPRAFLKPNNNLMVVFEESGGDPNGIVIMTVKRDNICTVVSEFHPALIKSWTRVNNMIKTTVEDIKPKAVLKCSKGKFIHEIAFASFGNPTGVCGNLTIGSCHSPQVKNIAEKACLGKSSCVLPAKAKAYGADESCSGSMFTLAVQAKCVRGKKNAD